MNATVQVKVGELSTLQKCLDRVASTQKRVSEVLTFNARQIEDERKAIAEAANVISNLIRRVG